MLRSRTCLHILDKIFIISTLNLAAKTKHLINEQPASVIPLKPNPHLGIKTKTRARPTINLTTRLQEAARNERAASRILVYAAARNERSFVVNLKSTLAANEDAPITAVRFAQETPAALRQCR